MPSQIPPAEKVKKVKADGQEYKIKTKKLKIKTNSTLNKKSVSNPGIKKMTMEER